MLSQLFTLLVIFFLVGQSLLAQEPHKTSWQAEVLRSPKVKDLIPELTVHTSKVPVFMVQKEERFRPMVTVEFEFTPKNEGEKIWIDGKIPLASTGDPNKFLLYAFLNSKKNEVVLVLKSGKDIIKSEKIIIVAPEAQEYSIVSPWDAVRIGAGGALLGYRQTGYNDFYSWNGIVMLQYHSPEKESGFGYNFDVESTVLTVKSSENDYAPQFLTAKADAVYFYEPESQTNFKRFNFLAGLSYFSVLSNGAPFGIKNVIVPDFGVRMRYVVSDKSDYYGTFRLLPFDGKFKDLGYELELSKSYLFSNMHRGEMGFKFLNYDYHPNQSEVIKVQMLSFYLTYSL